MKDYQRATGNELDTFLLRNRTVKTHPERFNEVSDVEGNLLDPQGMKRSHEVTGAGIEYATSLIEYLCTHHKDLIKNTHSALYYETQPIEWAAALDIMTGGIASQRDRAAKELLRLHTHPRPVLIKRKDGRLISMQPFVLVFDWGRPETLDARAAANLARMQKGVEELAKQRARATAKKENSPFDDDHLKYPGLLPIETISIQFSKHLFEDLFHKSGNTYSFPTGMYAKMVHFAQFQISCDSPLNDPQISSFARFARYIIRHNNLTAKQMKNKDHHSLMHIPLLDMASDVYPSMISMNGRGEHRVELPKMKDFLDKVLMLYLCIDHFLFYPIFVQLTPETLILEIFTDQKKAEHARGMQAEYVAH